MHSREITTRPPDHPSDAIAGLDHPSSRLAGAPDSDVVAHVLSLEEASPELKKGRAHTHGGPQFAKQTILSACAVHRR